MRDSSDPGGLSDGSRLAVYQTLSIDCPSSIFSWHVLCVIVLSFSCFCFVFVFFMISLELWKCCNHVYYILGKVEAPPVNVKKQSRIHTVFFVLWKSLNIRY